MTRVSEQLKYIIEQQMKEANQLYWNWSETSFNRGNSPGKIEKLKGFAKKELKWALEQCIVTIIMPHEYALPRFEWVKER